MSTRLAVHGVVLLAGVMGALTPYFGARLRLGFTRTPGVTSSAAAPSITSPDAIGGGGSLNNGATSTANTDGILLSSTSNASTPWLLRFSPLYVGGGKLTRRRGLLLRRTTPSSPGPCVRHVGFTDVIREFISGREAPSGCHVHAELILGQGITVAAVGTGPDWYSTALFISYDDFGGFYDSVVPGVNPDGTAGSTCAAADRVAHAIAGHTDSTPATFASILAYTEQTFGLTSLSANDAGEYAFSNAFDYSQRPLPPVAMHMNPLPPGANAPAAIDPDDPT